jgi:hypothetical protein
MLVIEEAKLPPPRPAVAATRTKNQYGVPGSLTANASRPVGTTSNRALATVQFRPPNLGTANVYGTRSTEPTKLGTATSQNSWSTENAKPAAGRLTTTTLHSSHTEKARCSARIEKMRFLVATRRPVRFQNDSSSGCQCSIQRPAMRGREGRPVPAPVR